MTHSAKHRPTLFTALLMVALTMTASAVSAQSDGAQPNQTQANQSQVAGRVIMAFGKVYVDASGKTPRLLKRRDFVYPGDRVTTRGSGYAQIRYRDGALMSIRPGTELRIDEFRFNGNQDGSERSFFSVIKGGFRTITGLIGKKNKKNYRVSTPIATIGIRGTHYGMRVCGAGECIPSGALDGQGQPDQSQAVDPGLYVEVKQGATSVSNNAGESVFGAGQNYYVANQSAEAEQRLGPFGFVFDKYQASGGDEEEEQSSESSESESTDQQSGGTEDDENQGQSSEDASSDQDQNNQADSAGDGSESDASSSAPAETNDDGPASGSAGDTGDSTANDGGQPGTPSAPSEAPSDLSSPSASPANPSTSTSSSTSGSQTSVTTQTVVAEQSTVNTDTAEATESTVATNSRSVTDGSVGFLAFTPSQNSGVVAGGRTNNNEYKLYVGDSTAGTEQHAVKQAQALVSSSDGGQFKSASATLAELNNLNSSIYYGRWNGAWEAKGVNESAFHTGSGSAHFIYTESAASDAELAAQTGTATFYLKTGAGSTPTDLSGNTGTMDHAAMEVNFGTGMVTGLRLDATVNNRVYTAGTTSQTSFANALFNGFNISGHCTSGCATNAIAINGSAKVGFANNGGTANQAMLAFGASDTSYTHGVIGTAVLERLTISDGGTGSVAILAYEINRGSNTAVSQFHVQRVEDDGTTNNQIDITSINNVGNIVTRTQETGGLVWHYGLAKFSGDGGDTSGMNWGRWDQDWTHIEGGTNYGSQGTAHMAFTDKATSPTDLATAAGAINSVVTFNRIGGTLPTDGHGNTGTVNAWQFNMDFSQTHYPISNYVFNATVAGKTINVVSAGTTTYGNAQAGNLALSGTCTGGCASGTATGTAVIQLIGTTASHALSGVTAHDNSGADAIVAIGGFQR